MNEPTSLTVKVFLILLLLITCSGILIIGAEDGSPETGLNIHPLLFVLILFLICLGIGVFAVLGGVGGGVIFTPLMLGFTPIDSYIVRTTGIFIAMAGALIASHSYLKKGIANIRILFVASVPCALFAITGALLAGYMHGMGPTGDAILKGILGILVIALGLVFVFSGGKTEYPELKRLGRVSKALDLEMTYWEDSLNKPITYNVTRAGYGIILFCFVGLASGLFGLGAGWAIVPVFNLVMLAPLKVAATCSTVMMSVSSTAAVWPYVFGGGMFPMITVPCMLGMVLGAKIGTRIMLKAKPTFIRYVIIGVMFLAGVRLITRAFSVFQG